MIIPVFADRPDVYCNVAGNKVTLSWELNQNRTVKIYRDGIVYKTFTNTMDGSFVVEETAAGSHRYRIEAINPGSQDYKSDEYTVIGSGKPSIWLEFINKHGNSTSVERIYNWVRIYNLGSQELDLSRMKIRYFYTIDGEPSAARVNPNNGQQKIEISDARINPTYNYTENNQIKDVSVQNSVKMLFNRTPEILLNADYYCDTYFNNLPSNGKLYVGYNIKLQPAFNKILSTNNEMNTIRNYNPTNDYSYDASAANWKENRNICVYYDDELIWGNDPFAVAQLPAPNNLTAVAKKDGILLNWDTVTGAEGYSILRKSATDSDFIEINGVISENSFLDTEVVAGETYTYKVRAVKDDGKQVGAESNEVTVKAFEMLENGLYAEYSNWLSIPNSSMSNYDYDFANSFTTNFILTNTKLALARVDPKIDFTKNNSEPYYKWGTNAPAEKVNANRYTVVWSGYVEAKYTEKYTFYTNTDDGVRLWIDVNDNDIFESNELLINNWTKHHETENRTIAISMSKYEKYKLKMEYFENEYDAVAQLLWESSSQSKEVIPTSQLFTVNSVSRPATDIGIFNYNIINTAKNKAGFVLGSYVPISMELKLINSTTDPKFIVNKKLASEGTYGDISNPFTANILRGIGFKAYEDSIEIPSNKIEIISSSDEATNTVIKLKDSYRKDTIIKLEFLVKISATNAALIQGIENYYGKNYQLNLAIADGSLSEGPFPLDIKVINPNKLN